MLNFITLLRERVLFTIDFIIPGLFCVLTDKAIAMIIVTDIP